MMSMFDVFLIPLVMIIALTLDWLIGEPRKYHPLVGFGNIANWLERHLNVLEKTKWRQKMRGVIGWVMLVLPLPVIIYFFQETAKIYQNDWFKVIFESTFLYLAIGLKSLSLHARQILKPLLKNDLLNARKFVGYIVSRDTCNLNQQQISRATVESVLENGHDAVIASLLWYLVGGIPMVVLHRLANTMDAMWGYKSPRFLDFGWWSARCDDCLGWPSAKMSGVFYIFSQTLSPSQIKLSLSNAFYQGRAYKSLNGGWVMAAGASVLNIRLGGSAIYHDKEIHSSSLGKGKEVECMDIDRSLNLVYRASIICVIFAFTLQILFQ